MEKQDNLLEIGIGTLEQEKISLKPAKVKIVSVKTEPVIKAKAVKAIFEVKHPDKEETINMSSVNFLDGKEVRTSGTWINLDKNNQLQKGTALVILLNKIGAKHLTDSIGKEVDTELEGKYLIFKAY